MITLKDFLEVIDYKITEGSEYGWDCYGPNVHRIERQIGDHSGNTVTCVFDTKDHFLYEMEAWDNANDRVYRWIHPDFIKVYKKACKQHDVDFKNAFDSVNFTDLDVEEDMLAKAQAIANEEEYDTRVQVPLELDKDQLYKLMVLAHERDLSLNEFVEEVLLEQIEILKAQETFD